MSVVREMARQIQAALDKKSDQFRTQSPVVLKNSSKKPCSVHGCINPVLAKGLCNMHWIRKKNNKPLTARHRHAKNLDGCKKCGDEIGGLGGWNLCRRHYKRQRRDAIKEAIINFLGGRCKDCNGKFDMTVFDFHHTKEKDATVSRLLSSGSVERICEEVMRCDLLCANCHRLRHANDDED